MSAYHKLNKHLQSSQAQEKIAGIYSSDPTGSAFQTHRYLRLLQRHQDLFHAREPLYIFSSPGRIELAGNHTDHNNGLVLASAVNVDILCVASPRSDHIISIESEGFGLLEADISDLSVHEDEKGTSMGIVRGVANGMAKAGFATGGFNAVMSSDVAGGSGLSSSAAYEVLLCEIWDALYNHNDMDPVLRAKISQNAENEYFGKPSGLMDQAACSIGGLVSIDFRNDPVIRKLPFRFQSFGYNIIVVNTHSSHDDLTAEYAAIPAEMKAVAKFFGKYVLREVDPSQVWESIPELKKAVSDRAILRSIHYFEENERVEKLIRYLDSQQITDVLHEIKESGNSSWKLLQNIYVAGSRQPLALALLLADRFLQEQGACRVHGGGFAGTTLNIVPDELSPSFIEGMDRVFGKGASTVLKMRDCGPCLMFSCDDQGNLS